LERKGQQPEILRLGFLCKKWGALPLPGGMLDQPIWLMLKMDYVVELCSAYNSYKNRKPGKEGIWKKNNPESYELLKRIGIIYGSR